jgi:hypothetical protein
VQIHHEKTSEELEMFLTAIEEGPWKVEVEVKAALQVMKNQDHVHHYKRADMHWRLYMSRHTPNCRACTDPTIEIHQ